MSWGISPFVFLFWVNYTFYFLFEIVWKAEPHNSEMGIFLYIWRRVWYYGFILKKPIFPVLMEMESVIVVRKCFMRCCELFCEMLWDVLWVALWDVLWVALWVVLWVALWVVLWDALWVALCGVFGGWLLYF